MDWEASLYPAIRWEIDVQDMADRALHDLIEGLEFEGANFIACDVLTRYISFGIPKHLVSKKKAVWGSILLRRSVMSRNFEVFKASAGAMESCERGAPRWTR